MYNILKYIFFKTPKTAYSVCQFPVEKTDVSGHNTKIMNIQTGLRPLRLILVFRYNDYDTHVVSFSSIFVVVYINKINTEHGYILQFIEFKNCNQ